MTPSVLLGLISAAMACGIVLGSAILDRRSVSHWAFLAGMMTLGAESLLGALTADATFSSEVMRWQDGRLMAMSFLPGTWLLFSLTYARGNYRDFLSKWRFALGIAFLAPVILTIIFRSNLVFYVGSAAADHSIPRLGWSGLALHLFFLTGCIFVLMNIERTYRAAVGTMRWRIKYMIMGLGVLFAVRVYTSSQCLLFGAFSSSQQAVNSAALILACLLIARWLFRSGRLDVNVYPSQAVLHHSLTILLAGIYLLIIGVFAKVVTFLGGDANFPLKAFIVLVSLVLLFLLLLSDRARLYTGRFVSRHFQRPLYNYQTVWRSFTEAMASRVKQTDLCPAAVKLVSEIFEVLSVTIWFVDEKDGRFAFGASSSISLAKSSVIQPTNTEVAEVIRALRTHRDPIDIDATKESWAKALRKLHPAEFRKGGHRICVPMTARGELMGIMVLGDRVGGIPFSTQDFDLLRCVGDQVAASLLNIELSQRLMQAKEFEAFQTMSAFFVHDMKNTASTLSLMLQNFPVHYNDPAFREDALRAIGKSAKHVNDLVRRLTLLRQEMVIKPVETDLNQIVSKVLAEMNGTPQVNLVEELGPLPAQFIDPEQIEKVVLNLVLNAWEALNGEGEIRVTTAQEESWSVLTVTDNGSGMSAEFVRRSLFRPFQTTKKQGIGIGMFQSKMIVEAHSGRIEVETELGKGTTFRVLLPVNKK